MELLEVGGRLVYSTCSLNPLEDEAVVHRLILEAGKANVVIEDAQHLVPGLKFVPGLESWQVGTKEGDLYTKWEDVPQKLHNMVI
jgi:tRNA (cytosine34-C5)-methyltransferase